MAMARVSSGLAYPERFYAAAAYVGFVGSPISLTLLFYALYQQFQKLNAEMQKAT